jgi:hypothetical protein
MKVSGYKIYDAATAIGAEADQFAAGKLEVGGTADAAVRWQGVPVREIVGVQKITAVAADVAWTQTFEPAGTIAAGDEFYLTVQYGDSRQRQRKVYKHIAVAGAVTPTDICDAFRVLVNGDEFIAITATGAATLVLTADAAGTGVQYIVTSGATNAATFAPTAPATADVQKTDAAYFEAKYEFVDADDFGSSTLHYTAYIVSYEDSGASADGRVLTKRVAAIFIDGATAVTALETALDGTNHLAGRVDILA